MKRWLLRGLALLVFAGSLIASQQAPNDSTASRWWSPGDGAPLAAYVTYPNTHGQLGILNTSGAIETKGHPFFEPIGGNGRACVSCHQPANAMSISVQTIQERWRATRGEDPIFASVDGMICPDQPRGDPKSHSLLLERGLFRVCLPWPPKGASGSGIEPEFTIEVVREPSGGSCPTSCASWSYDTSATRPTRQRHRSARPTTPACSRVSKASPPLVSN